MPRLAYLFERFPSFGQTFCYREVQELLRQGVDVDIFSIRRPVSEPAQDWDPEVVRRVHYLPEELALVSEIDQAGRRGGLPQAAIRGLREWGRQTDFLRLYQAAYVGERLRRLGVTRVHAHFAGMAARTCYWIREFFGIDYSLTAHANDIFAPREFKIGLGEMFHRAAAVITVSDFSFAQLRERFPVSGEKVHRIYNGVELRRFTPARFDSEPPLLLAVGRLIEKKGFADLVSACAMLRDRGRAFHCEIAGEGPLQPALAAQIENANLQSVVRLSGPLSQTEVAARMTAARVFALPSVIDAEGGMDNLPTVIMEAMASGLPVVSTTLAGIPEMVEHRVTGELIPPRDPTALADALERLLCAPEEARRWGENGRAAAAQKFSLERNVGALRAILARD
ncbi:MAG: glycosyltransferase [Chthoniobacterales bacterium]